MDGLDPSGNTTETGSFLSSSSGSPFWVGKKRVPGESRSLVSFLTFLEGGSITGSS